VTAVCVVRPSSLGDIVLALAIVDDVMRAAPGTTLDWVAEEAFAELPALSSGIRRVVPLALRRWRRTPFARSTWREMRAFRTALRETRYDAILDLQEQVKGALVARTARGVRHGFVARSIREPVASLLDDVHHRVPKAMHVAQRCRQLAGAALGHAVDGPPRWRLAPPAGAVASAGRPYAVVLHATSREGKLWPEDRWRSLLATFAQAGLACIVPWGSAAERERSLRIVAGIDHAIVPDRQTLTALASLLAAAELVVGVDTGLTHLAAAIGSPVVAVFTETDASGAGVAIAGRHARDVGGNGRTPPLDEVLGAAGEVSRHAPRC
jgi:heptosyltransferase-1